MLSAKPRSTLTPHVYRTWNEVALVSTQWEELLQQSIGPSVFSTPEWLGAWWDLFGRNKDLLTVAITTSDDELVGLAPLYREKLPGGIRRLRLLGDGPLDPDHLDLIFRAGYEDECTQTLLDWLAASAQWDVCELNGLPLDSRTRLLRMRLEQRGWMQASYQRSRSAITFPPSWDLYLKQLSHEYAYSISRYTRRLHRRYTVRMFRCMHDDELPRYLELLFDLHQKRWTALGQPGNFASPNQRQFYTQVSRALLRRGWLEFWLLELDGQVAAAELAVRYGDDVIQLQTGFDLAYYADRVGRVLKSRTLQHFIAEGAKRYDFLSGDDAHKRSWGAQVGSYTDLHFANPQARGALFLHLEQGARSARAWLRRHASPAAYSALKTAFRTIAR
jgi:CelD/BcsL family acetyltransferase involved in cellulose biosynthesis